MGKQRGKKQSRCSMLGLKKLITMGHEIRLENAKDKRHQTKATIGMHISMTTQSCGLDARVVQI